MTIEETMEISISLKEREREGAAEARAKVAAERARRQVELIKLHGEAFKEAIAQYYGGIRGKKD